MAKVVQGTFTKMVCIYTNDGCQRYIPLSKQSTLAIDALVDLRHAKLIILDGEGIFYGDDGVYGEYTSKYVVEA